MNAVSVKSSFVNFDESEINYTEITSKDLCRAVFDDLLDKDLLGFLLSSSHFRKYLNHYSDYVEPKFAQVLKRNITNSSIVDAFQEQINEMFKGFYIAEATIRDQAHFLAILEEKYVGFANGNKVGNVCHQVSLNELNSVEMAWKYRGACGAGRIVPLLNELLPPMLAQRNEFHGG